MDAPPELTDEEWTRLRVHWNALYDYEQLYFQTDRAAFLEWVGRNMSEISATALSDAEAVSLWLEKLVQC